VNILSNYELNPNRNVIIRNILFEGILGNLMPGKNKSRNVNTYYCLLKEKSCYRHLFPTILRTKFRKYVIASCYARYLVCL
jgi:hypothetical protein